jgi:hypothetical protein
LSLSADAKRRWKVDKNKVKFDAQILVLCEIGLDRRNVNGVWSFVLTGSPRRSCAQLIHKRSRDARNDSVFYLVVTWCEMLPYPTVNA